MGACCVVQNNGNLNPNSVITNKLKEAEAEDKTVMRIFLLGPGDSGKSTILKQMKKIYTDVDEQERGAYVLPIQEAILSHMHILSKQSVLLKANNNLATDVDESLYGLRDEFIENPNKTVLTDELVSKIETLWGDKGIKMTLEHRSLYQIPDNVAYFLDKVREIGTKGYIPSFEDYIRFRMRTTGYVSDRFDTTIKDRKFTLELTDVGGQRAERKKWLYLDTSRVHAILFIMAIAEYDMMLYEADNVKRLDEAFSLFIELMKKGFFVDKTCVIFFNKYDLFLEKIKTIPITVAFPDFPDDLDPHNPEVICEWLFGRFKTIYDEQNRNPKYQLHYHCTTALDTTLVENLLRDIQVDVIRNNLATAGYM